MDLWDFGDAAADRDEALARVADNGNDWLPGALALLPRVVAGREVTGEQMRDGLLAAGLPRPHHHNAWGALVMAAVRKGLIEKTGRWVPMAHRRSHARMTPTYRQKV